MSEPKETSRGRTTRQALRPETEKRVVFVIEYTAEPSDVAITEIVDKARETGEAHVVDVRLANPLDDGR